MVAVICREKRRGEGKKIRKIERLCVGVFLIVRLLLCHVLFIKIKKGENGRVSNGRRAGPKYISILLFKGLYLFELDFFFSKIPTHSYI